MKVKISDDQIKTMLYRYIDQIYKKKGSRWVEPQNETRFQNLFLDKNNVALMGYNPRYESFKFNPKFTKSLERYLPVRWETIIRHLIEWIKSELNITPTQRHTEFNFLLDDIPYDL
jgi:hypothetical protein